MSRRILPLLPWCLSLACLSAAPFATHAGSASARIQRVSSPVADLAGVSMKLDWPARAKQGRLRLRVDRLDAPELGYRFRDLDWNCLLTRDANGGWQCDGDVTTPAGSPFRLSVALEEASTEVVLARGQSKVSLHRDESTPDLTRIDLAAVPMAWTQALLSKVWADGRLTAGTADAELVVNAATDQPLQVSGPLRLDGLSLDTPDGSIAAENIGAELTIDTRFGGLDRVSIDGYLRGGELLLGNAYVALEERRVALAIRAEQDGNDGWRVPELAWRDPGILSATGSAGFDAAVELQALDLQLHSDDLAPLATGYLSAWLGLAGLTDLQLAGTADAQLSINGRGLQLASLVLEDAEIDDPAGRFAFTGLRGDVRYSATAPVDSALQWNGGQLYGLDFGAARLPFSSGDGRLQLERPVTMALLGGQVSFDHFVLVPPAEDKGTDIRFGLSLAQLEVARLTKALGWPAFGGQLSGNIPMARYRDDRLEFDGGLQVGLFDGNVSVTSLAMERPFGVAPTLSADIRFDDLDLQALTGAFDFGSITGRLDGHVNDLRLIDWQAMAFDAQLHTDRQRGVRQRISQRAVQDLSSVGDASFVSSLQGQLIGLFDDFGYRQLGIGCRLVDQVCTMTGLGSAGAGFTIVQGSGLPRLSVVGFNRQVDWPTLVERLAAVGAGDVKPVVE